MTSSQYVRREPLCDFAKFIDRTESMRISSAGLMLGSDLRWSWQEVLYCAPEAGATSFELLSERQETFRFVYAGSVSSDSEFEFLKQQLRRYLKDAKPGALVPD
jgi:hypothetical protein